MTPVRTAPSAPFQRAVPFATAALAMMAACVFGGDAQARPAAVLDHCSWDKPGLHPFMGDVVAAVDRYQDIPEPVRTRLKARMEDRNFDEFVTIDRDTILGQRRYEPGIREMHFGEGRVCKTVTRTKWSAAERQAGLVYC